MNLKGYPPAEWKMMVNDAGEKSVGAALDELIDFFRKNSDTPALDAQVALAYLIGRPRSWVLAHPEAAMTSTRIARLEAMFARLKSGDPLPYILGCWEFFGLKFGVTPDVLIPRPETELLVERAITWLQAHPGHRQAADVGTGSGCIGIALAVTIPDLEVTATDISPTAVRMARRNAVKNGVAKRMDIIHSDLFPPEKEFNLIVANLPYIPTKTLQKLPIFGREPTLALDGGKDGLDMIRRLLTAAPDRLIPGGLMLVEIEASQGPVAVSMAFDIFTKAEIHLHKDLAGRDRILEVQI
jgi:release factor glutamine methyltransferase